MNLDLARWQFGMTSIYHFIFVPITIGLAVLIAILETVWVRGGNDDYRRLARFFGTLLLINVAVGVVTGLIQEFEFGMNWSYWARYVGNVFGGPLAMEGLVAFFLESTFLGLWIFGWDRLSKRVHLACIWCVAAGACGSALFILAANSWMQHPVGYHLNSSGQPQLNDIWALFTNPVFLWAYTHVLLASFVTGCVVMLCVSCWHLLKRDSVSLFRRTATITIFILIPLMAVQMLVGSELGVAVTKYQPMKIAASEAVWNTCPSHCSFSIAQVGGYSIGDQTPFKILEIPSLLSILATNHVDGEVQGLNQLQAQYQKQYGPGNYIPNVFVQYWSMRTMAYIAVLVFLLSLWGIWALWRRSLERSKWFQRFAIWAVIAPFLMNTAGWLLTENGRQPWIVQGLMKTATGVSPSVSATEIWITIIGFLIMYIGLGAVCLFLMLRFGRRSLEQAVKEEPEPSERSDELELVY